MTQARDLEQLVAITTAIHQTAQQAFQRIAEEENQIRAELGRLDALLLQSRTIDAGHFAVRSIGADILWQASIAKNKEALNLRLARVLAQKEPFLKRVRESFGKLEVSKHLQAEQKIEVLNKIKRLHNEKAIESAVFRQR